jgi:hypothetical protein
VQGNNRWVISIFVALLALQILQIVITLHCDLNLGRRGPHVFPDAACGGRGIWAESQISIIGQSLRSLFQPSSHSSSLHDKLCLAV